MLSGAHRTLHLSRQLDRRAVVLSAILLIVVSATGSSQIPLSKTAPTTILTTTYLEVEIHNRDATKAAANAQILFEEPNGKPLELVGWDSTGSGSAGVSCRVAGKPSQRVCDIGRLEAGQSLVFHFKTFSSDTALVAKDTSGQLVTGKSDPNVVTVEARAPMLGTTTVTAGQTIDQRSVQSIPLNGRHFVDLALLIPGSVMPPQNGFLTAAGRGEDSVNWMLNGIDLDDMVRNQVSFDPTHPGFLFRSNRPGSNFTPCPKRAHFNASYTWSHALTSGEDFFGLSDPAASQPGTKGGRWSNFSLLTPGVAADSSGFGLLSFRGISTLLNNNTVDIQGTTAPLIETTKTDVSSAVTDLDMERLPTISGTGGVLNDYAQLALTAPGVKFDNGIDIVGPGAINRSNLYKLDGANMTDLILKQLPTPTSSSASWSNSSVTVNLATSDGLFAVPTSESMASMQLKARVLNDGGADLAISSYITATARSQVTYLRDEQEVRVVTDLTVIPRDPSGTYLPAVIANVDNALRGHGWKRLLSEDGKLYYHYDAAYPRPEPRWFQNTRQVIPLVPLALPLAAGSYVDLSAPTEFVKRTFPPTTREEALVASPPYGGVVGEADMSTRRIPLDGFSLDEKAYLAIETASVLGGFMTPIILCVMTPVIVFGKKKIADWVNLALTFAVGFVLKPFLKRKPTHIGFV